MRRALALSALLAGLPAASCGEAPSKNKAVECHTDDDCDTDELGICDIVSCENNRCEVASRPDGHRCDDSDPVTGEDACLDGICAGVVKVCEDDLGPCLKAVHDPVTDECVVEPVEDGVVCDDEDACTQVDSCQRGECVGAEPKSCDATDDCHVAGECDPTSGECTEQKAEDGTACDDGQGCTVSDSCSDGACTGEAVVCDDGLSCSTDSCDETSAACVSDMSQCSCVTDQDCGDGNACNGSETCNPVSKLCQIGTPVVCGPSGDACQKNVCVAETGACEPAPVENGTSCDDASACTAVDTCQAGECVGSDAVVCTALSQCHTAGVCDETTGQCSNPEKPNNSSCNDANACTTTDRCQAGACVGGGQVTCQASDQCHVAGVCNPSTGACTNPSQQDGVKCSDGNACTNGDSCRAGVCAPAAQVVCGPLDSCHLAGTCDTATGVCSNPVKNDGAACGDGLSCTSGDKCTAGKCGGTKTVCDDNVACTVDSCSEQLGGCTVDSSACACKTSADCNDGNPCNGIETCNAQTLQCQSGAPVDCSSLDDACNVGACSPSTGACVASPKANGATCDDGNLCTQASSCQAGVCQGTSPVVCTALDQCHDAGSCNPGTGKCTDPVKTNGSACNDGTACTKTDTCQAGVCTGAEPVVCTAIDQCHTAGTCDASTGLCSAPAKTNGSSCSDGSLCTQTDTCQGGVCLGASPITCTASDQCHGVGTCNPSTGTCSDPVKKDGTACADNSLCTRTDTCQAGVCTGSNPVTCTAKDQCHTVGTCDGATGVCSSPAKKDGTACVDNSLCTQTDTCQTGVCTGGNPITCSAKDQCHDAGTCDAATGVCSEPPKTDNTPCNDSKACTNGDKCVKGVCGGAGVTCNDGITCTVDSCQEPTGCNFDQSKCGCDADNDCNDGNACNGVETCNLGTLSCVAGTAVSCGNLDDACNVGVCDAKTGACSAVPRMDGTGCNDGNACTKTDGCVAGKCVGSSPVTCTASDQCHNVGVCDTATGVCSNPNKNNGSTCNDGNACTQSDSCQAGVCTGASPVVCTASDQCHSAGTCDTQTGVCSNPIRTGSCNDGNACTQTDTCSAGACVGSNPVVCAAKDQCHDVGSCNTKTGICSEPAKGDGTPCSDSNACTKTDTCQTGVCTGADAVTCTAVGQCYKVGTCDKDSGLCSNPFADNTTACNDGNACTTGEKCDGSGTCAGGSTVVCQPPANPCQTNTCNPTLGCQLGSQPTGTPCDDSSECTQLDQCVKGSCTGTDPRANVNQDWADDPGFAENGPVSVDIFTDKDDSVHITGIYRGPIRFDDKDQVDPPKYTPLTFPKGYANGIYWAVYKENGAVASVHNIGGSLSTLTVNHAVGHRDGSLTLLGVVQGTNYFGRTDTLAPVRSLKADLDTIYVAHYGADGSIAWLAHFNPGSKIPFTAVSLTATDDDSVVATGDVGGSLVYFDDNDSRFGPKETQGPGVWAAMLDKGGNGKWAGLVATTKEGSIQAHAVASLEDGLAFTGTFARNALLGPTAEVQLSATGAEDAGDVWFMKLDNESFIKWGGSVAAPGLDYAGDVVRVKNGMLLMASTAGEKPTATDAVKTQPLFATSSSTLQTHVLAIDAAGNLTNAGLIASVEKPQLGGGGVLGYQLELDYSGSYSVAGVFARDSTFWNNVGFGSGPPPGTGDVTIVQANGGPLSLFVGRLDPACRFPWAAQAGGDGSGFISGAGWDIVLAGHSSRSLTVAGQFRTTATFGDERTESLVSLGGVGNPFVVHLNSEAEYDYCPAK